jgi:hypothetical protein
MTARPAASGDAESSKLKALMKLKKFVTVQPFEKQATGREGVRFWNRETV